MAKLTEITRTSSKTIWMFDLAHQKTPKAGRRFVVVTRPDKMQTASFREEYHGRKLEIG